MSQENPYLGPLSESYQWQPDTYKLGSLGRVFVAWIIFFLVATISGAVVGGVASAILNRTMRAAGIDFWTILIAAQILGFVLSIPISFLCYWWTASQFIVKPVLDDVKQGKI